METNGKPEETELNRTEEILARIAGKIREDSQNLGRLTGIETINILLSDLITDDTVINLVDMQKDSRYQDIKSTSSSAGDVYLYSEIYITANQIETLSRAEDVKTRITSKVREDSGSLTKLTGIDTISTLLPDMDKDKIEASIAEILNDDRYTDIKSVIASTGAVYLYSETVISKSYADLLVRAEANDPCATIAATVRDEARIYPRATKIEFFNNPVFNISPEEFKGHLASTQKRTEFKDIKTINASTGAVYLYSDLYMSEDYARSLIEWDEVGQFDNP
ncbi:hypothetical protein ACFLYQ_02400 [Chloroflexota bacterium]